MIKHPVPNSLLVHIGDMTVSFALLESVLQGLFGSLIREHQRVGQILSAQLSFGRLLDATISLYKDRHGEDSDYCLLKDLLSRAVRIEENRNSITHSVWGAAAKPDAITRIKVTSRFKTGYQVRFEEYDATKFQLFVDDIKTLVTELMNFQDILMKRGKMFNAPTKRMW